MMLDSKLSGVPGWRRTETDVRRRELVAYRHQDVEAQDGMNVVLTLDSGLQHIVELELAEAMRRHEPISASAVVVRPRTGEILAMATLPNFDPNKPGEFPMDALRNRVISDVAEPGSTFKIVVVSAALNEGIVSLDDTFHCENGSFYFGGRRLRDYGSYGLLTVKGIITKSSNIGTAKIGIQMGEAKLHQYIRDFGFGVRTGLPLPGEVNGIVHPPKQWSKISIAQIPMGHGIAVTPLQMTMAMAAIANDGVLMRPALVRRLEDPDGNLVADFQPQMVRRVVSETAARQMNAALQTVVLQEGTGKQARLEHYTAAAKTGTAQKAGPGGYMPGKYFSSFIGFFPADFPELCITVVLDEPKNGHFGGSSAGPVFKGIAERSARYLNIKPDTTPGVEVRETLAASGVYRTR
jgi:cell division protein FtsI/penicillin-binding protein 2